MRPELRHVRTLRLEKYTQTTNCPNPERKVCMLPRCETPSLARDTTVRTEGLHRRSQPTARSGSPSSTAAATQACDPRSLERKAASAVVLRLDQRSTACCA